MTNPLEGIPPGPDYYAARRALWLSPNPAIARARPQDEPESTSRRQLNYLLSQPLTDDIWRALEKVWKGLAGGGRLKRRLPLSMVIKIIHAAWMQDNTWPVGRVAPEPDDVLLNPSPHIHTMSSETTDPWMAGPSRSGPADLV
ncbi:hypothetical protein DL96DRAFT_1592612 [Flagelloscypha sp. PMI_526]|nr:hypothetical protein DL96DRAFT_1592612 [Flagelloscypha sp. PMI_526]